MEARADWLPSRGVIGAARVYDEESRSAPHFKQLCVFLYDWAEWHRRFGFGLGMPQENGISRLVRLGNGASGGGFDPRRVEEMGEQVERVDEAIKAIEDERWRRLIVIRWHEQKNCVIAARRLRVSYKTAIGWKDRAYWFLKGRLEC